MCRSIKPLFHFDPPASVEEIRAASLQFVRKISGFHKPSKANQDAFQAAVEEIADASARLIDSLRTDAPRRERRPSISSARDQSISGEPSGHPRASQSK
jgi:hypothetical protein